VDSSSHVINMSLQTTLNGNTSYPGVTGYPGISVPDDGAWHQITVMNYTMASAYDSGAAWLYLQTFPSSGTDDVSFYITDFQLTYVPPPTIQTGIPSIYKTYAGDFPIGTAVDSTDLSGPHAQLLAMHYNSMTPGNDLKWSSTEPSYQNFNYTPGDALVGEAVCHGMKVRGQNLVWATGAQTPSYAFGDKTSSPQNQAQVTQYIQEHIRNEVQHYGKEVYAWDVVNEPIDPTQSDCLAHGPFYQVLGPQYINIAFQAARQYAPSGTKLFLNDYSLNDPAKLACLVKVLHNLLDQGVPIDGVGHEMHNAINYPSIQMMANSIQTIHREFPRLEQQVTELDESVYPAGNQTDNYGNNVPPSVLAEQGWLYKDYFDLFRHLHRDLTGVTMWGMADDDTWLDSFPVSRTDYPLPFDMHLQAKPAYWGIVDPTQLPGYGLSFSLAGADPSSRIQTWTVTAQNGDAGPAYATQITSLTLRQTEGKPCQPTIAAPAGYPVSLGDIAASGTASATFKADFTGCGPYARFTLAMPWVSATYHTGTFSQVVGVGAEGPR
jgi:endo-1,4-beta-xylanase